MSFGQATRNRFEQLRKMGQNVPKIMEEVAEGATIAAVERATELTAEAWTVDSVTKPVMTAASARTMLANNMQYASYVNDGHDMDEHYVPGLHIDSINGGIYFDLNQKGGIVVGTKTKYVKGKYMKQAAIGRYRKIVRMELDKRIKENFK